MSALVWIDYAIVGLFFIFTLLGLIRGFASEVYVLIVWCIAVWVGLNFSRELAVYLEPMVVGLAPRTALALLCLCFITFTLGVLIAFLLGDLIKITGLRILSRFFGMLVGTVRTVIVITLLVILAGMTSLPAESWWREAQLIFPFQQLAIWLRNHASSGVAEYINYE